MRPPTLMFCKTRKYTVMPVTPLVARRNLASTWSIGPRSALGFNANEMRPWLTVVLGPPTPTVELA